MNYSTLNHQCDNFLLFLLVLIAPAVNFFFNSCDVSSTWELFQPFGGSFNKLSCLFYKCVTERGAFENRNQKINHF